MLELENTFVIACLCLATEQGCKVFKHFVFYVVKRLEIGYHFEKKVSYFKNRLI
mgnify:CR=1 FL=1